MVSSVTAPVDHFLQWKEAALARNGGDAAGRHPIGHKLSKAESVCTGPNVDRSFSLPS